MAGLISGFSNMIFGSPPQPTAPDYTDAAEATAEGNLEAARIATEANRADQYTPWGSSVWTRPNLQTTFDQTGYDAALAAYNNRSILPSNAPEWATVLNSQNGLKAPNREDFTTSTGTDQWTQTTTLSPEQQALFNTNTQTNQMMADTGLAGLGAAKGIFETPMTLSGATPTYLGPTGSTPIMNMPKGATPTYQGPGTYGETKQRVMDALMARTTADVDRARETTSAQLISQGIPKGSEAYNREMEQLDRRLTDAKQQAEITGTNLAGQEYQSSLAGANAQFLNDITSRGLQGAEAQQAFTAEMQRRGMSSQEAQAAYQAAMTSRQQGSTEAFALRNQPLNELNALRTGNQVSMPQFSAVPQQQTTLGADYMGATTAQGNWDLAGWNADVAQNNAMISGLFSLGGAAMGGG